MLLHCHAYTHTYTLTNTHIYTHTNFAVDLCTVWTYVICFKCCFLCYPFSVMHNILYKMFCRLSFPAVLIFCILFWIYYVFKRLWMSAVYFLWSRIISLFIISLFQFKRSPSQVMSLQSVLSFTPKLCKCTSHLERLVFSYFTIIVSSLRNSSVIILALYLIK